MKYGLTKQVLEDEGPPEHPHDQECGIYCEVCHGAWDDDEARLIQAYTRPPLTHSILEARYRALKKRRFPT